MAAKKILTPYDFQQNEIQNARIQNLGADPGSPVEGQIWWNTTSHTAKIRNNTAAFDLIDGGAIAQSKTGQLTLTGGLVVNTVGITGNQTLALTGTGASSVGGTFSATQHIATGQTGAATSTKYAGGTASGAPGSGTFSTGDWVVSNTGDIYVCTSGGTPGTWVRVGSYLLAANNTWSGTNAFNNSVSGSGSITMTSTVQGTALIPSGLTGATAASRYVGATATGAPATGTFAVGDFVIAQSGGIYICTGAGSPGTWTPVTGSSGYTTVKANNAAVTARATVNFINGTYTTATAVDNASQSDVKFDVNPGSITPNLLGAPTADWSFNSKRITNLLDPASAQDAATKAYVDSVASGLDVKASVRAASTATVTVTYSATGGTSARGQITAAPNTLDGVSLAAGNRILLKNQSTGAQNGIWVVSTLGTGANGVWDRATDFDQDAEVTDGAFTFVEEGTTNANTGWVLTTANPITIGGASGTALTFAQFSGAGTYAAGNGLTLTGSTFAVGAGTGIVVSTGTTAVNRTGTNGAHVALIYTTATHSSATSVAITHNLGNQWVVAQVFDVATSAQVECDVVLTSSTVTTFNFAVAPSANSLRFVIWG